MAKDEIQVIDKDSTKLKKPPLYKVILLNDDYTTFEFVIELLTTLFRKTMSQAEALAKEIHQKGSGVAGVYTYEIAETKVATALILAKQREYPLILEMEPE